MDASRQLNNDESNCTATSMYLSFDEESTISAAFKTLETINEMDDISNASQSEIKASANCQSIKNILSNSVERKDVLPNAPLKSINMVEVNFNSPLRATHKNMLEFKAVSSTPSKDHKLLTNVFGKSGGNASNDLELEIAFSQVAVNAEENKENILPDTDDTTLSVSSIACSTIEKTITATISNNEEETKNERPTEVIGNKQDKDSLGFKEFTNQSSSCSPVEGPPSLTMEGTNAEDFQPKDANLFKTNDSSKAFGDSLPSSKCSRILPPGHRQIHNKDPASSSAVAEMPKLLNKMLHIAGANKSVESTAELKKPMKEAKCNKKDGVSSIPAKLGEKRHYNLMPRMSVVVKTTLNSPARKIARKSIASGSCLLQPRRSVMPTKVHDNAELAKATRKSMLPRGNNIVPLTSKPPKGIKPQTTVADNKNKAPPTKSDATFVCNVCKEKFRIKSIMDAHKRSHEVDLPPPVVSSKKSSNNMVPSMSGNSLLDHNNQCKYCDKKFALLRALHIHLLQNCVKIPPADKRKLQFTEMDHVEKAQLPRHTAAKEAFRSALPRAISKQSIESLKDDGNNMSAKARGYSMCMKESSLESQKLKQKEKPAHTGVHCTPRKLIPCHLCKLTFKSVLDYTNHNLSTHYKKQAVGQALFQ